ncbi:MAG: hypothetical protein ACREC5_07640, partial [Thermoplasmata archaeon]
MKHILAGAGAVVIALVVVLSGLGVLLPQSPPPPVVTSAGIPPTALKALESSPAPALPDPLGVVGSPVALAAEIAPYVGLSSGEAAAIGSWLGSLSAAQLVALKADAAGHLAPTASVLDSLGLTPAGVSYYCLGSSVVAGAAVGGIVGGPLGALIGGIAGAVVGYYGCQQSGVSDQIGKEFQDWASAVMGGYGNEANLTAAEFQSIASALNVSTTAWERAADHAALSQLGNSSFNISLALFQSGTYANLAPVASAYQYEVASEYGSVVAAVDGHGGTNDVYGPVGPAVTVTYPEGEYGGACGGTSYCTEPPGPYSFLASGASLSPGTSENFVPNGANLTVECNTQAGGCPSALDLYDQVGRAWHNV